MGDRNGLGRPISFHQAAVPAQDCGRSDQAVRADDGSDRQIEYYRALAPEYLDNELDEPGAEELLAAVEEHAPGGTALELACGPGTWTPLLLRRASHVTAVDAAAEMLALARARVGADHRRVRFVRADLFDWQPPFSASAAAPHRRDARQPRESGHSRCRSPAPSAGPAATASALPHMKVIQIVSCRPQPPG